MDATEASRCWERTTTGSCPAGWTRVREEKEGGTANVSCGLKLALELQATWRKEIERDLGERPERVRFRDYARSWVITKAPPIKPARRVKYATSLDVHILPALGDHDRNALQPHDVKAWVAAFLESARGHEPSWHPLILTLAYTGLRFGEATSSKASIIGSTPIGTCRD